MAFEVTSDLKVRPYEGPAVVEPKSIGAAQDYVVTLDESSVVITEGKARYRLPISTSAPLSRPVREAVTERFLLNAGGSFFVLPYPTAGGASRIKPVCTHDKRITDFCTWRADGARRLEARRNTRQPLLRRAKQRAGRVAR